MAEDPSKNQWPARICASKKSTFFVDSLNRSIPEIIQKIVDQMSRYYYEACAVHGQDGGEAVKAVIGRLSQMRHHLTTDKTLEPFTPEFPRAKRWNELIEKLKEDVSKGRIEGVTWFKAPYLFVECQMYARIWGFFHEHESLRSYDYFRGDKEQVFSDKAPVKIALGAKLVELLEKNGNNDGELRDALGHLLQAELWGNKCDLSMSGRDPHRMTGESIFNKLDTLRPNILVDDVDAAVELLLNLPSVGGRRQLAIVLNNVGVELFADLCLADFLLAKGLVDGVAFHGKAIPWFVSNVMESDLRWTLADESDPCLRQLGARWNAHFEKGLFSFAALPFWTESFSYDQMRGEAPDLYEELAHCSLVVFKGDLNYRKLTGDLWWPHETPFKTALRGFEPAALLALRTLKSETVVGLKEGALLAERFPTPGDLSWMTSGDYSVVQLLFQPPADEAPNPETTPQGEGAMVVEPPQKKRKGDGNGAAGEGEGGQHQQASQPPPVVVPSPPRSPLNVSSASSSSQHSPLPRIQYTQYTSEEEDGGDAQPEEGEVAAEAEEVEDEVDDEEDEAPHRFPANDFRELHPRDDEGKFVRRQ